MITLKPLPKKIAEAKTVILFGLGREAVSTYVFLKKFASLSQSQTLAEFNIILFDDQPLEVVDPSWKTLVDQNLATFAGSQVPDLDASSTILFLSPGIPPSHPVLAQLLAKNIRTFTNTELALQLLPENIHTIGVTGTKGKSTTSALIHHVLSTGVIPVFLGGNIGKAALDVVTEIMQSPDVVESAHIAAIVVFELSCHQLRNITVSPHIAVILDITQEHLDYYGSFEEYCLAKSKIIRYQLAQDLVVYNPEHQTVAKIVTDSAGKKLVFQTRPPFGQNDRLVFLDDKKIKYGGDTILENCELMKIFGLHNRENALPSVVIAKEYGISNLKIADALLSFTGLPHRLQFVTESRGVRYFNDSLSTTPEATVAALQTFRDFSVILIAGGHDRHLDFRSLAEQIHSQTVTALITFAPTGEQITRALYQIQPNSPLLQEAGFKVSSMSEAVSIARKMARPGDVVLLSPGSASFGLFKDYADRGNQFSQAVMELATGSEPVSEI